MKNNCKIIQYHIPQKIIIGEEYIDYFMVDMFPGKKIRESNNGKNVRKIKFFILRHPGCGKSEIKSSFHRLSPPVASMVNVAEIF